MSRSFFGSAFFFLALFSILWATGALAAERMEEIDQDKDGRKETKIFYEENKKIRAEIDRDGDGKPEQWVTYDSQGKTKSIAKDSNHDGKPDLFQEMLKGRNLVLKESDRNYDGKIDQRVLQQWDANKRITTFMNGRPGHIPNPGYTWIWKERDNDFDGKIDDYLERGNKNPSKEKIGQPMRKLSRTG